MFRRPPRSPRTYTLFPSTSLFRSRQKEPASSVESGYFLEEVRRQLIEQFGETAEDGPNSVYAGGLWVRTRSEEHTSELQSLMRISYAVFCLKKNTQQE